MSVIGVQMISTFLNYGDNMNPGPEPQVKVTFTVLFLYLYPVLALYSEG